jgi:uncharacterized protein YecE (DUF72 family)
LVLGDIPSRPFQTRERTADWTFVRFHYGRRGRRGNYSDRELAEWATWLSEQTAAGDVYAYFNNDWEGFAVRNGLRLRRLLAAQLAEATGVVVTQPGGPTGAPAAGRTAGRRGG